MPTHFFPITTITQVLEDETFLTQALNFHEITRFETSEERAIHNARINAEQIIKEDYANELYKRVATDECKIIEIDLEIKPPKKNLAWRKSVQLKLHAVQSIRKDGYYKAFIPALTISVITKKKTNLEQKLKDEILFALQRDGYTKSLQYLRWLERIENLRLEKQEIAVQLPRTKQRAIAEEKGETKEKSVLKETATALFSIKLKTAYEVEKQTEIIADIFKAKQKASILLVGKAGVGKTAIFHQLVNNRNDLDLTEFQFWATSGAKLIAGQTGFGMWQERCQKLIDEAKETNAILHLGSLIELLEVGKSNSSTQGIASFLRPKIARGEIICVVECTPEQLPILERNDPNLLGSFQQIHINEPNKQTSLKILNSVTQELTRNKRLKKAESDAINTIESLHRRYSTYSSFPGRPVQFLRNIFSQTENKQTIETQQVIESFSNETGLPQMLLSDKIPLELSETKQFFENKVIGQNEAVGLITKLIATVKTKLTRPQKPIASLLFIGPTGVGKTEMVKSLTEFFFTNKDRMIRFDMSEFSNPLSVQRLIGGTGEKEGLLTAKVREQPFSVILLDEFEKAHSSFFDLLLQILGEGRLTDSVGRVADFTNSIIVMTSNLGASEFQRGKSGFLRNSRERKNAIKHFDSAVKDFLRPEIFNRIDRIVPFSPLDENTVLKIADLEINKMKLRDGLRYRPVELDITKDAFKHLATKGYDVRYGARPLKRTLERELLAPLSAELNLRPLNEKLYVRCRLPNDKITLDFVTEETAKNQKVATMALASSAGRIAQIRRKVQKFLACYRLTELKNEMYQIVRIESRQKRGKWISPEDYKRIERKEKVQNFLKTLQIFNVEINSNEDEILLEIYGKKETANKGIPQIIEKNEKRYQRYLFELLKFQYQNPNEIKLALFSENSKEMFRLANLLRHCVKKNKGKITSVLAFTTVEQKNKTKEKPTLFDKIVWRKESDEPNKFIENSPNETFGLVMQLEGKLALPRFGSEIGVHRFPIGSKLNHVVVSATSAEFNKFKLPENLAKRDSINAQTERRIYDFPNGKVKDLALNKTILLVNKKLNDLYIELVETQLQKTADNLIE